MRVPGGTLPTFGPADPAANVAAFGLIDRIGDKVLLEWDDAYPNAVDPVRWPAASTGPTINPSEHFTLYASLAELSDTSAPSAHVRAGFTRLSPWWPCMRMGTGVDGVLFGRLFSRTARRGLDDVPPPLPERLLSDCPSLEAPTDWDLGPSLSSWEAFALDVPPEVLA